MNSFSVCEELDLAIERMVNGRTQDGPAPTPSDRAAVARAGVEAPAKPVEVSELLGIADDLRHLPRPGFKTRLMVELEWAAAGRAMADSQGPDRPGLNVLPTLS